MRLDADWPAIARQVRAPNFHELGADERRELRRLTSHPSVVAVGEIGLDYHFTDYHRTPAKPQVQVFRQMLGLAQEVENEVSADDEQVIDVLLIEDDKETLEMYKLKLEKDGYRVHVALDGEEGMRRATDD